MTRLRLGILGYPLGHTLSPMLQCGFLECAGLDGQYELFEVPPEDLDDWFQTTIPYQQKGFNVTIPHKVAVIPYLREISQEARLIGAVNTVIAQEDGLYGTNTDAYGFLAPLESQTRESLRGRPVLILGAGGASRAVAYGLLQLGGGEITFHIRSLERAQSTRQVIEAMNTAKTTIHWVTSLSPTDMNGFKAVINTTPIGMHPHEAESPLTMAYLNELNKDSLVYDLVYNPLETRLLQSARQLGLKTQDGLDMLIYQGAKAFELWTGHPLSQQTIQESRQRLGQKFQD